MYFIPARWRFSSVYSDAVSARDTVETILFSFFFFPFFFFSSRIASNFTAATKWQNLGRETRTQRVPFTRPKWTKACHGPEVSDKKSFQGGRIRCHVFFIFFYFFWGRRSENQWRYFRRESRTKGISIDNVLFLLSNIILEIL